MKARKKNVSRISALLLALVMMLSLVPTTVFAADGAQDTTIVIAGSDFQYSGCTSTNHTPGTDIVRSLLAPIKSDIATKYGADKKADGFLFCGDYYKDNNNQTAATNGLNALKACVKDELGSGINALYVQGNHDVSGVPYDSTGAHDAADYGVYEMNWDQYNGYNASYSASQTMANNLTTYFANRKANHPDQPIFIISHQGLHAGPRTIWGDTYNNCALYAMPIFNAINEAAEDLNIIYLFGHNHSKDFDSFMGGSAIFLTKGDTMLVSNATSSSGRNVNSFTEQTLNFTYMNAGYVGYYDSYSDADDALTMTCFEIKGNQVTISRYDTDGLHNLKGVGYHTNCTTERGTEMTNFVNNFQPDTKVYTSPQVVNPAPVDPTDPTDPVDPEPEEQTFTDPSGISVVTTSGTGLSVSTQTVADDVLTENGIDKYQAYDINIAGYEQGKTVTVTMPVPSDFNMNKTSVYHVNDGTLENMDATIADGVATFTTNHFSTYMVAESDWVEIPGESNYVYTQYTGAIESGEKYLIVAPSNAYALVGTTRQSVTISDNTISTATNAYEWEINETSAYNSTSISCSSGSYTLSNPTNYYYMVANNDYRQISSATCTRSGYSYGIGNTYTYAWTIEYDGGTAKPTSQSVTIYTKSTAYTIEQDGKYLRNDTSLGTSTTIANWTIDGTSTYKLKNERSYYLRYRNNDNNFTYNTSDNNNAMRLFKLTAVPTPGGYAAMAGEDYYTFALGRFTSIDELKDYIRSQIKVYTADNTAGTNQQETDAYTLELVGEDETFSALHNTMLRVSYNGELLGTVYAHFVEKNITSVTVDTEGSVYLGAKSSSVTGSMLTVTYEDGTTDLVPVTLTMVSDGYDIKKIGAYNGLTITYEGKTVDNYTLNVVVDPNLDPYPKNPNQGSVTISKTATGIDFKNTGVAQVELSAKGIPMAKSVDVIVMLDTSSSMLNDGRNTALSGAVEEMLKTFRQKNADGSMADIDLAIASFNGFTYLGNKTASTVDDQVDAQNHGSADNAKVFTGSYNGNSGSFVKNMSNGDFIKVFENISEFNDTQIANLKTAFSSKTKGTTGDSNTYYSGTNYDSGFDTIYRLATAKRAANEAAGEERELYVIFMTDGATHQYNYTYSKNQDQSVYHWNNWLNSTYPDTELAKTSGGTRHLHPYYYYPYANPGSPNLHYMAEAIKGDPDTKYEVISPRNLGNPVSGKADMYEVSGLGATLYTIGFGIADDYGFTADAIMANIQNLPSKGENGKNLFYDAANNAQLSLAFLDIAGDIRYAATEAHFEDEMGDQYDLQIGNFGRSKDQPSDIKVVTYDVWTRNDNASGRCTIDQVGTRKGTSTTVETVTFNANGTVAKSSLLDSDNILSNGLIIAKNFVYNTTDSEKPVTFNDETVKVGAESFYWNLGTVGEKEYALQYYVYLTGTMEGKRDAGSYPTNDHATLFYTNYAGANVKQDAPIPVMPWEAAVVKYAAYLVDEDGNPIDTKGNVTGFADRVVVTNPQLGGKILLNSDGTDVSATVLATRLPKEYTLYDPGASYTVRANSNGGGSWTIERQSGYDVPVKQDTTYVTGFNGANAFSNATSGTGNYDYTATTVWFAVVCKVGAIKDVVVIDYGLPVDISVMSNDMFFDKGTLDSIGNPGASAVTGKNGTSPRVASFSDKYESGYGTATVRGNYVRYQVKDMNMDKADSFYYAVNYDNSTYYYGEVTVIPATTIYYEDSFVTFDGWDTVGKVNTTATQDEDRPGEFNLTTIDANNVYGYDSAYKECSTYSLGSAHKVTVDSNTYTENGKWPTAQFTFTGTGFDVVSVTSNMSGFMKVDVYQGDTVTGTPYKSWAVDTYYGYTFQQKGSNPYIKYTWTYGTDKLWHISDKQEVATNVPAAGETTEVPASPVKGDTIVSFERNGEWVKTSGEGNDLYQIPVIKSEGLTYGKYTVVISAMYANFFNHTSGASYDLYLDAIRIYDPAKNDTTSQEAYVMDKEATPSYLEIRNNLIDANKFAASGSDVPGAVFIDGLGKDGTVSDYTSYGPNNEVYLDKNQAVAFKLTDGFNVDSVQLGVKAPMGQTTVRIDAIKTKTIEKNGTPEQVTIRDTKTIVTKSATDMFYDITELVGFDADGNSGLIIITCTDGSMASLTNIKVTHVSAPAKAAAPRMMMSAPAAKMAADYVSALYLAALPVEQVVSEEPMPGQVDDPEVIPTTDPTEPVEPEENDPADNSEQNEKKDHKDKKDKSKKDNTFKPDKMDVTVNKDNIKVGDKVTLNVKTSQDVKAVTVNGENAVLTNSNEAADEAIWSVSAKAAEAGVLENAVVAYDEDGTASEEIISVENVKERRTFGQIIMSFIQWIINWISGWFKG